MSPRASLLTALLVCGCNSDDQAWIRQFGTVDSDDARGVATDRAGNVFYVGGSTFGLDGNQNATRSGAFLAKYGADGTKLWTRQFGAYDDAIGVATDAGN